MIVSSDSHVVEPPDLWLERVPEEWRERAPQVIAEGEVDYWWVDGVRSNSFAGGAQPGRRFDEPATLRSAARFADVMPGAYLPDAHVADNLADGIAGSVLYPTEGLLLFGVADLGLLHALCVAYNDWIAEFCAAEPTRLKGVGMVVLDDVGWAIAELTRCRDAGLSGVMLPVAPHPTQPYGLPEQERFWAAASDLAMPISLHIATNRGGLGGEFRSVSPSAVVNADHWVRTSLADLILTGVLERHPTLRVGSVEHELGWVPFFLDRLDYTYTQRAHRPGWHRFAGDALPSDYFRGQVFVSFQEDALGIRDRALIGIDGLMFGSDYPHTESTFPRTAAVLAETLAGVPADDVERIVARNCAELYGFDLDAIVGAHR